MTTHTAGAPAVATLAAADRARIAALLSRYPDVSPADLAEINTWFDRSATALDVGLLAAEPAIAEQYRAWRKEHYDRFGRKDLINIGAFIALAAIIVGGIVLMMP